MQKPKPKVRVITWSKEMRLKRRYQVTLMASQDGSGIDDDTEVAIQRYANKADAEEHANILREALAWTPE